MNPFKLTRDDCMEIFCALESADLQKKIGIDGELLADGEASLTDAELDSIVRDVTAKLEELASGRYDESTGECDRPGTCTYRWKLHMRRILAKLAKGGR